jgi:hypothetical protein
LVFGFIEVATIFDQLCTQVMHRCVLLDRIAARHYDRHGNTNACSGKSQRLAVIATRCGGDPLHLRARLLVEIDDPAAHLERANRRVVLVLHHYLHTGALLEQRPGLLRGRGTLARTSGITLSSSGRVNILVYLDASSLSQVDFTRFLKPPQSISVPSAQARNEGRY